MPQMLGIQENKMVDSSATEFCDPTHVIFRRLAFDYIFNIISSLSFFNNFKHFCLVYTLLLFNIYI